MNQELYKRRSDLLETEIDDDIVVLDMRKGFYFSFEGAPAAELWKLIERATSEDEIIRNLTARFDVAEETCRQEVERLMTWLKAEGLIEPDKSAVP